MPVCRAFFRGDLFGILVPKSSCLRNHRPGPIPLVCRVFLAGGTVGAIETVFYVLILLEALGSFPATARQPCVLVLDAYAPQRRRQPFESPTEGVRCSGPSLRASDALVYDLA